MPIAEKILITGAGGLVGSNFLRLLPIKKNGDGTLELADGLLSGMIICPPHNRMDISDLRQVKTYFEKYRPNVVIHFAAYRDATSAELERNNHGGLVWKSNVEGVKNISKLCCETSTYLIHISTDMVFSGKRHDPGPYSENHPTEEKLKNLSWYGWTKKLGEDIVKEKCDKYSIIRIGNVTIPTYDPKLDYIGKIVWLYNNSNLYPLFADQKITLSYIPDLANMIKSLLLERKFGTFHLASNDIVSPHELGQYVVLKMGGDISSVKPGYIDEYLKIFPNRYPKFGGLKTAQTEKITKVKFSSWRKIADNFVKYMKIMKLS